MLHIQCLIDNTTESSGSLQLKSEHGLSFLITEEGGPAILFDSGQSDLFLENIQILADAGELAADLSSLEHIIISHGHYDHANGLLYFQRCFPKERNLWLGEGFFDPKWAVEGEGRRYLGPNWTAEEARAAGLSLNFVEEDSKEICNGYTLIRNFPRLHSGEQKLARFQVEKDGEFNTDSFNDECALVIERGDFLIVLVGCAHPGIINMLSAIEQRFKKKIGAVLGGSHLVAADNKRISETIDFLNSLELSLASLGHCSGELALERFKGELFGYSPLFSGAVFSFD